MLEFRIVKDAHGYNCEWCSSKIEDYCFEHKGRKYHHQCFDELEDLYYQDHKLYPNLESTRRKTWDIALLEN
jgi:hypothetical protein